MGRRGLLLIGLVLIGGCEPEGSEILMDAHELLGVDRETFVKRLSEQFIVRDAAYSTPPVPFHLPKIYYNGHYWVPGYELKGQGIYISCMLLDMVDLPGTLGDLAIIVEASNANMTVEEYLESKEGEDGKRTEIKRQVVAIIEILLPYEVSKSAAAKMLGYQLSPGEYSEDGFWQDKESGDTITVTHGPIGKDWNIYLKTRIMVSVGSRPTNKINAQ